MGTPIEPITFKLDISATDTCGNNTFSISGTDRSTYSLNNDYGFNGFVQQLYYHVGDNIEISFNSNGQDISFIIFDNSNIYQPKFEFDKYNPKYTISFEGYDNYKFGDSSLNAYGIFNSYILKADTRDDLNSYISSKYNASDKRNRLQQFNRDDRRFIGNYDYIKSDATRIGVDSSGVNNDLIIQSVTNDIHIVTGEKQRISIWGNLQVHGNINYTGILLPEKRINYEEEKLYINNLPINQYLTTIFDNSFNSINQNITIRDTSLSLLDSHVTIHDTSLSLLDSRVTIHDTSLSLLDSHVTIHDTSLSLLDSRVTIHDTSLNNLESTITMIDNSLNLLNFDTSYVSYDYFETSYNSLIIEISNKTIDITNLNIIPDQSGNDNKFLFTDGSNLTWKDICLNDYTDVSFGNVDISGILKLNNINILDKITIIDGSLNNLIINNHNIVNPNNSISIGITSNTQGDHSIAIGTDSGKVDMSHNSLAIGYKAGEINMGNNSIALGNQASLTNPNNYEDYIVFNATSNALNPSHPNALFIKPIRNENNNYKLLYNSDSGEITYQLDINSSSNINLTNFEDASFNNVDISGTLKINSLAVAVKNDITNAINNLVSGAPGNLDTLNELASALDNSSNFASVVTSKLSNIDISLSYLDSKALDLTLGQDASFNNIDITNEITTHKITASGYYVGSRSIISGSAQGNFTDLELKDSTTNVLNLLAYGSTGDISMNGTLSVNNINGTDSAVGVDIEGVTIKNNGISTGSNGTISATNFNIGSQNVISATRQINCRDLEVKNSLNNEVFLLQGDSNNNLADLSMSGVFKLNNVNISDKLISLDNDKADISNIITEFIVTTNSGKYFIDNIQTPELTLDYNKTYRFKQDDSTNSSHPLRFYTSNNNISNYSSGVTIVGTTGTLGSYSEIIIDATTPNTLYYHCSAHSNMGNKITIINYPLKLSQIDVSINNLINNNIIEGEDVSFGNVDISGSLLISGNLDISYGMINFFASDEQLLGPDSGIIQKVQDLSNNLLTSNNDASFNNVDISGNLKVNNEINCNTLNTQNIDNASKIVLTAPIVEIQNNVDINANLTANDASFNTVSGNLNPPYDAGAGPGPNGSPNLTVGFGSNNGSGRRWYRMSTYELYYGTGGLGSDDRIKHNEVNVSNGLIIMRLLTPKKYKKSLKMYDAGYNGEIEGDWNWETGLIAQEILKIPDVSFCVKGGDRMVDGELKEECHYVDYNSIFSYNIAATKELDTIVQQQAQLISSLDTIVKQQAQLITSLEGRLLSLESK